MRERRAPRLDAILPPPMRTRLPVTSASATWGAVFEDAADGPAGAAMARPLSDGGRGMRGLCSFLAYAQSLL